MLIAFVQIYGDKQPYALIMNKLPKLLLPEISLCKDSKKNILQFIPSLVTETIHYCQKPLELNFNINTKNQCEKVPVQ